MTETTDKPKRAAVPKPGGKRGFTALDPERVTFGGASVLGESLSPEDLEDALERARGLGWPFDGSEGGDRG